MRYGLVVAVGVMLGILAGLVLVANTPKSYLSTSTLFLSIPAQTAGELNDGNVFAEARVQSYVDVATSPAIVSAVIKATGSTLTTHDLQAEITASAPPNKVLLNLAVQDASAQRALVLCTALSAEVIKTVDRLESDGKNKTPVRLSIVRAAELPTAPAAPRSSLYVAVAALLGLVVGSAVAIALARFTELTVPSRDQPGAGGRPPPLPLRRRPAPAHRPKIRPGPPHSTRWPGP